MKNNILSKKIIVFLAFLPVILFAFPAQAICPVCTLAVCCGMGLSRWLGISDTISGLWIGALIISLTAMAVKWLEKKKIDFELRELTAGILFFSFFLLIFQHQNLIGIPENTIFGIDKLIFGIFFGSIIFILSNLLHLKLKKRNGEKSYFPFQKVAIPIAALLVFSLIFYFII
ncbi:MAG: hypothetical protein V1698_01185 [bacterium]